MRTKTLLLTAALSAAGLLYATAQEPVFSVNAVGYVKKTVGANQFALLTNPLNATGEAGNSLDAVLPDAPVGTSVFEFNAETGAFVQYEKSEFGDTEFWAGEGAEEATLEPGEGFFVRNSGDADIELVFVGEVPQGTVNVSIASGFSLIGSAIPQQGTLNSDLELPSEVGDSAFLFQPSTGAFAQAEFSQFGDETFWSGPGVPEGEEEPIVEVAEGFFYRSESARSWERTFSVNDNE